MSFNEEEMDFMIAHVARDGDAKPHARLQKLLEDLAGVATDPAKPKKKEQVHEKLKAMRRNPVQLQRRLDQTNAINQMNNSKNNAKNNQETKDRRAVAHEAYHEQLAASGKVTRDTSEVRDSRPARVDVQV